MASNSPRFMERELIIDAPMVDCNKPTTKKPVSAFSHHGKHHADTSTFKGWLGEQLEQPRVEMVTLVLILLDLICVVVEIAHMNGLLVHTAEVAYWCAIFGSMSLVILGIFTFELGLKMYAFSDTFWSHFWSVFDFVVISAGVLLEAMIVLYVPEEAVELYEEGKLEGAEGKHEIGASGVAWVSKVMFLVVAFRLARIVHMFHAMYEETQNLATHEYKAIIHSSKPDREKLQELYNLADEI